MSENDSSSQEKNFVVKIIDDALKPQGDLLDGLGFILYFVIGIKVLKIILIAVFSLSFSHSISIAMLVILLTAYPFFIRNTPIRWRKDKKQWTFLHFAIFSVILTIMVFFI